MARREAPKLRSCLSLGEAVAHPSARLGSLESFCEIWALHLLGLHPSGLPVVGIILMTIPQAHFHLKVLILVP